MYYILGQKYIISYFVFLWHFIVLNYIYAVFIIYFYFLNHFLSIDLKMSFPSEILSLIYF